MTLSKKLKPFMTYMDDADYVKLKRFAKAKRVTMAKILREGLMVRMAEDNPYINGFNDGLNTAIKIIGEHQASQMRFPSGKSFGELINEEIAHLIMREVEGENIKG